MARRLNVTDLPLERLRKLRFPIHSHARAGGTYGGVYLSIDGFRYDRIDPPEIAVTPAVPH